MGSIPARKTRFRLATITLILFWIAAPVRSGDEGAAHTVPVELIVTRTSEEAGKLLTRAKTGDNFEALARQYSIDPTASDGGYLGSVDPDHLRAVVVQIPKCDAVTFG